jgi:uncharacterized protein (TIGR03437 family)
MLLRSLPRLLYSGLLYSGLLCSSVTFAASAPTFPVLTYSTYLRDSFTPKAIATDISGNIYIAGNATVDPATSQTTVLVVKLNPQASQYLYVRYLGGSVNDQANAIAVDLAGDAYIAGSTTSPDFPVTSGGNLAQPAAQSSPRSFVAKLDPNGNLVFSDLLGGYAVSAAQAVAVTASNQVLVSGTSMTSGFPSTGGSYNIANTAGHPYLLELDPTGTQTIFSATGIGGSAIALDSSGNIYVAGTTYLLDYPTTPGAYQTTFPVLNVCLAPCESSFQGANQYVTKVNSTGSTLIYSTAVSGSGQTTNAGLAVDAAGDVYLTGYAGASYPYTVAAPSLSNGDGIATFASPFLTKLDPLGQTLLFSIPVGGAGVQVEASGSVYVGGGVGFSELGTYAVPASLPALASVPTQCLPNVSIQTLGTPRVIQNSAYVAQVDAASGNLLGTQFIGGSGLTTSAVALYGSTLWAAGATTLPDFPFTPNALTLANFAPTPLAGAYLGAVDFSQPQPPAGTPQIACIVDAADLAPAGPVARYQLLTIFGTGLGPATGGGSPDGSIDQLAGVNVNFGLNSAPLLYVSSTQINLAVPLVAYAQSVTPMQVEVNGVLSLPLELPLTYANPSLFPVALNADGSLNSAANPAHLGSAVSVFVNGLTPDPQINSAPLQLFTNDGWSVIDFAQATPYVLQVNLQVPATAADPYSRDCIQFPLCAAGFTVYDIYSGSAVSGLSFGGSVYITETP